MAERKRRGLGRGLGALINSDAQEAEASGATAHALDSDVSHETEPSSPSTEEPSRVSDAEEPFSAQEETASAQETHPARPIDVFFSAKSHLGTQRVSRETPNAQRPAVAPVRTGKRRSEIPDVLSRPTDRKRPSSPSSTDASSQEDAVTSEDSAAGSGEARDVDGEQREESHAWTQGVAAGSSGAVDGAEFRSVPVEAIRPNPRQPRQEFDEEDMAELVHSVREIGVLQPVVVRPLEGGTYELVMGERRWRASKTAEHETIPAIVRSTRDDDLLRDALLENVHRSQLNPLEEAAAYRQLLDDFKCTQDELSERIGRSRPQISNTLRLMNLPPGIQRRVAAGVLSSGHARALLSVKDQDQVENLATRIVAEGLSVRAAEEQATLLNQGEWGSNVSRETNRLPTSTRYQQLDEFADALTDRLDTQVKITLGAKKGRIAIDFASIDDLHRLMDMIGTRPSS